MNFSKFLVRLKTEANVIQTECTGLSSDRLGFLTYKKYTELNIFGWNSTIMGLIPAPSFIHSESTVPIT